MNIQGKWKTFGVLANFTFKTLVNLTLQCRATRLDFVADCHPALSIKKAERSRRAEKGVQRIHMFGKDEAVPKQWKKFMTSGENKESLLAFLIDHWRTYKTSQLESILNVYITSKEKCHVLSPGASADDKVMCNNCAELESNHEEADTRLLLRAKHAMNMYDSVIIKSPDTDVFILCTAMQQTLGPKNLLMMTGTGKKHRTIHINSIVNTLGEDFCRCFLGFHAYSGNNKCRILCEQIDN